MAITQRGGQDIKSTRGAYFGSGISQADAFEGLLTKLAAPATARGTGVFGEGKGTVVKTSAIDDKGIAGVLQNVSTPDTTPVTLDTNATPPGGTGTCVLATSGNVLMKFDGPVAASDITSAVVPSAANAGQVVVKSAPAATDTIVGYVVEANSISIDNKDIALVQLIPV